MDRARGFRSLWGLIVALVQLTFALAFIVTIAMLLGWIAWNLAVPHGSGWYGLWALFFLVGAVGGVLKWREENPIGFYGTIGIVILIAIAIAAIIGIGYLFGVGMHLAR